MARRIPVTVKYTLKTSGRGRWRCPVCRATVSGNATHRCTRTVR